MAGQYTVVTVGRRCVVCEREPYIVYLLTSLRGVLKCKKGSLPNVYSGQDRTYRRGHGRDIA